MRFLAKVMRELEDKPVLLLTNYLILENFCCEIISCARYLHPAVLSRKISKFRTVIGFLSLKKNSI
jgi:hypothetical protein